MHFLGIDIGTSSISGVVCDRNQVQVMSVTQPNDANLSGTYSWEALQDPDRILHLVEHMLADLLGRYTDVAAIGITGQMHGILYVDARGEAVSPLITWQDGRGNQCMDGGEATHASFLSGQTGYSLSSGYGLVTHFYDAKHRIVPGNAAKLCTVMDYVVMKLTGSNTPVIESSNAAGLGLFDLERLQFDHAALARAGIDARILPEVCNQHEVCGYYRQHIPIYPAIGDNQAAFRGSVSDVNRSVSVTVGTSSQVSVYTEHFIQLPSLDTRPFPGGGYMLVGAALCGGQSIVLLKTFFEKTLALFNAPIPEERAFYRNLATVSDQALADNLLQVDTQFAGTRSDPALRGRISNISMSNLTPEHLIAGFLKGIATELSGFYHRLPEPIRREKTMLVGAGNALKKNLALRQAFESQFGAELYLSAHEEEAAYGACLMAAANFLAIAPSSH